jgi:hypothetical protein
MPRAIEQPLEISPLAGHLGPKRMHVDMARLEHEYYSRRPDLDDPNQLISFDASGHGGSFPCDRRWRWTCLRRPEGEIREASPELIRLAWSSPAALAKAPFQDLLNLGREGRMNVSGSVEAAS